jgi:hypothetical protein
VTCLKKPTISLRVGCDSIAEELEFVTNKHVIETPARYALGSNPTHGFRSQPGDLQTCVFYGFSQSVRENALELQRRIQLLQPRSRQQDVTHLRSCVSCETKGHNHALVLFILKYIVGRRRLFHMKAVDRREFRVLSCSSYLYDVCTKCDFRRGVNQWTAGTNCCVYPIITLNIFPVMRREAGSR